MRSELLKARRGVNNCLGWYAAANQACAPSAVTLDDDSVETELPSTDGSDVAARSSAYYQDLAFAFHDYIKMVAGCSSICFNVCIIWAPL